MPSLDEFRFPVRDASIWGLEDEYGEELSDDDKAAALDQNQRAVEDYLTDTLPEVYIQQSTLGSGTIDPTQLATGTAGTGKAPVSQGASAPAWTDIATQAELDAQYVQTFVDIQRGRVAVSDLNGTNTAWVANFAAGFAATPRVTAVVECGRGVAFFTTLTAVTTTTLQGFVTALSSTTATCFVHWHAVKA